MQKLILSMYITLDGVIEEPGWSFPFWSDEAAQYARDQLFASDTLLLGRVTYEGFAKAWPSVNDEQGFAERMNQLPKFVASTTLKTTAWNARLLEGDVAEAVSQLKQQPGSGQDILIYGSGTLVSTLRKHNLIDEYRLWVHPVVLGHGKRLFPEEGESATLKLISAKTLESGVVILSYHPAKN